MCFCLFVWLFILLFNQYEDSIYNILFDILVFKEECVNIVWLVVSKYLAPRVFFVALFLFFINNDSHNVVFGMIFLSWDLDYYLLQM